MFFMSLFTAAIPIVDPEFQLLPIHYHIDPGEAFVWKNVGNPVVCKQMLLSHEQKLNLIRRSVNNKLLRDTIYHKKFVFLHCFVPIQTVFFCTVL